MLGHAVDVVARKFFVIPAQAGTQPSKEKLGSRFRGNDELWDACPCSQMMRVGDRYGERIRGVGAGDLRSGKKARDHGVDLRLLGAAGADDGFLNERRGIFADRDSRSRRAHQSNAARLTELERRLRVLVDEHFLDRGGVGLMLGLKLNSDSRAFVAHLRDNHGLLTVAAGENVVRVLPPLNIDDSHIAEFIEKLSAGAASYTPPEA